MSNLSALLSGQGTGPTQYFTSNTLFSAGKTANVNSTLNANVVNATGAVTLDSTIVVKQGIPIRIAGGNTVTLALTDNGKLIRCANSTSAMDVTVPLNSSVAFPTGAEISVMNELTHASANSLTITLTSGVTLISKEQANTIADRYTTAVLKKVATDTWALVGNLA
jgi:hypothetical protein